MADEHITVKLPQLPVYPSDEQVDGEDMIYVWNSSMGQLQHAKVDQLPFGSGGGDPVTQLGSPFIVSINDEQVTIDGTDTIVSDSRLMEKTGYPVSSTQSNTTFRRNDLIYDDENGSVTIKNFILQPGEEICLIPQGKQSGSGGGGGGSLQPIWDEINSLKAMLAPFMPTTSGENHARVWWTGSRDSIPEGWVEDTDQRGYYPAHAPSSANPGSAVGSNNVKLTGSQQGSFEVRASRERAQGTAHWRSIHKLQFRPTNGAWGSELVGAEDWQWSAPVKVDLSDATDTFDNRPQTKYGIWIKYVGG